jgi:hypothetical protein
MSDRLNRPRQKREIPRSDWLPESQRRQQHPLYDPNQRPKFGISFGLGGSWWVWLAIGIGLTVVVSAIL